MRVVGCGEMGTCVMVGLISESNGPLGEREVMGQCWFSKWM